MISTLLVANRGEIALRVMRTAARLGIRTVAVYSDADHRAPHVRAADEAVRLGPASVADSYLNIAAVVDAAVRAGADAVHPGYGFLSEQADFARAVAAAGLTFVGPPADVMDQMGRKDHARRIAVAAGVPVVPAWDDAEAVLAEATFPVLVKAAAGGGGKGMRVVHAADDLAAAIAAARREATTAFGDDTIVLERFVERGRHVEVQILADGHGNVVHLHERDCSTQRRHQKVIEEAPAPTITPEQRELLTSAAVALATQVGYVNAGTAEFLVDDATDAVFFLEMNTRLQVEHPVTEEVVRVRGERPDLVEHQLRIAAGEPLGFTQADVTVTGHAIEARVYAEDAFAGFLPQAGIARLVRWSDRTRNEVALVDGQEVGSAYDPMIGKVIAAGRDRETARRRLVDALDETHILGLTTNLGFLRTVLAGEEFTAAAIDTAWLDRTPPGRPTDEAATAAFFAVWAIADDAVTRDPGGPFGTPDGWRLAGPSAPARIPIIVDGQVTRWAVSWHGLVGPDHAPSVRLLDRHRGAAGSVLRLEIDGRVAEAAVRVDRRFVEVSYRGLTYVFDRPDAASPTAAGVGEGIILAPMPGAVLTVDVATGDRVAADQRLGILEAMKMEHSLTAPFPGTVTRVEVATGDQVALHQPLFEVEADDDDQPA